MDFTKSKKSWVKRIKPTELEIMCSDDRLSICVGCGYYVELKGVPRCKDCGCSIVSKIYGKNPNPCQLGFWEEIDKKYDIYRLKKLVKTIL